LIGNFLITESLGSAFFTIGFGAIFFRTIGFLIGMGVGAGTDSG
jgi:hypothetical protein